MLIKPSELLTLELLTAVSALARDGSLGPLESVIAAHRSAPGRDLALATAPQDAIRIFVQDEKGLRTLPLFEVATILREPFAFVSRVVDLRSDPARLEDFRASGASHDLAFATGTFIQGHDREAGVLAVVDEGRTGRKFVRTAGEVIDFVVGHPERELLFSDITMQMNFAVSIESAEDFGAFLHADPDRATDFVIRLLKTSSKALRPEAWLLEPAPDTRGTFDIHLRSVPDHFSPVLVPLDHAAANLSSALQAILAFAADRGVQDEASPFSEALAILETSGPLPEEHQGLSSRLGLGAGAGRLMAAALAADAFGGMGSWNDAQTDQDAQFARVSNEVALCIFESVCASANAATPRHTGS
jgi:hypothetical protein